MEYNWKAGELALTYNRTEPDGPSITRSADLVKFIRPLYGGEIEVREKFFVVGVSRSNKIRSCFELSSGGCAGCVVDPKLVFSRLLLDNCSAFVCSHNHPSGTTTPSAADKRLTENLKQAGKVLDIALLDHVIVTANGYKSFADIGLI
jgi:DNA repair protein RadC